MGSQELTVEGVNKWKKERSGGSVAWRMMCWHARCVGSTLNVKQDGIEENILRRDDVGQLSDAESTGLNHM